MGILTADGDPRLSLWLRVREFAVPPTVIETATARRQAGDWAGACAAASVDVDVDLRAAKRAHGREFHARVRSDLRYLAPDLLRWHMPRVAPDGLLRPGLTVALADYGTAEDGQPLQLVARTPPSWAGAGQRISLALWDGSRAGKRLRLHPHPHPGRRFRLDLHRHLWDARRAGELRTRSGADRTDATQGSRASAMPATLHCAVERWAEEAGLVLADAGRTAGPVVVRASSRRLVVETGGAPRVTEARPGDDLSTLPVLPDAATWTLPDLELLRGGLITPDRLHPLVAAALVPGFRPPEAAADPARGPQVVECRGALHRVGFVDGRLAPLDHDPVEIRREELLMALTGTPLPCLQVIDQAHRRPDSLSAIRERLNHGDYTGALTVVEALLGPGAVLREGSLRDALDAAVEDRIAYGLYRAGLVDTRHAIPSHWERRFQKRIRP
ncbi:hypothetical protein [Yinghuangia seranimata]|uniref:hypothetical protein n=1 Tax=Yinghuangia seranimata TaxID=408067 RepID=UPI00248C18CB|nr:hypothetical protein [Yinghuangia seranimata]MDI2128461.1 hypothetical protein [Yinghuangia seranimata]